MTHIHFGTSGHRGIIGQTFTNQHVAAIGYAISDYLNQLDEKNKTVLIGFDTRTGNSPNLLDGSYTQTIVQTLLQKNISVDCCDSFAPTPLISWAVRHHDYALGIILTASHNPPNYNGIKINDGSGAPASLELTTMIQEKSK